MSTRANDILKTDLGAFLGSESGKILGTHGSGWVIMESKDIKEKVDHRGNTFRKGCCDLELV